MRYAMALEYDGSPFMGWQKHQTGPTIQTAVEQALSYVADAPVEVVCSGRTDARVSAQCQLVHFDSDVARTDRAWLLGTNTRLPDAIRALWVQPVVDEFSARFSARAPLPLQPADPSGQTGHQPPCAELEPRRA